MLAKLRTTTCGYGRKNTGREVYQQSFIQNICKGMIKAAVNAALRTESTERWSDMQFKLNEFWDNGERNGMGFSVQWHQTKLCSLITTTNSAAGCQLSIWKQMKMFGTDHYLTVGSQCEDITPREQKS